MATMLDHAAEEAYLALVRAFPLVSIRDDAHLHAALATLDRLIERSGRSVAEEAYLGALTDLVETYENAHVAIPPTSGVAAPLFGSPSIISEVLAGKRRLALAHMERLAAYFGLPISVFVASEPGSPAQP